MRYDGKIILVTGGSRGIGRDIVTAFADAGARVFTCGRTPPETPLAAEFMACDVRDADAVTAMIDAIGAQVGRIDVVINNAGGAPQTDAATASPRFSERIIALNLLAPIHVARAAHRWIPPGGSIINIASVSAVRPSPGTAVYAAAKAGLLGLTRSLAHEWAPAIRVNAIIAGLIETETADFTYGSAAARHALAASLPAKRLGTGQDIANAALFLASDLAAYVNGEALTVDGGGERPPFLGIVAAHAAGVTPNAGK
jgi:NAD(P)-dependent dehydrogenase (short-subunit alcohol dehydrogenase family)